MSKPTTDHPWIGDTFGNNIRNYRQPTIDDDECVLSPEYREKVRDIHSLRTRNVAALKLYEEIQERKRREEEEYDPLF